MTNLELINKIRVAINNLKFHYAGEPDYFVQVE